MRQTTPNILDDVLGNFGPAMVQENNRGALVWLPLARFYDNPFQPRASYDDVESLADSIWALRGELPATLGLQQPPVARVVAFDGQGDALPVDRAVYGDLAAVRRLALSDKHAVELHFGHRRLRAWRLLREYGISLGMPHARPIGGLWELRPGANRFFYVAMTGRRFVVLHGYRKRSQAAPQREIDTAQRRWADLLDREKGE